MGADFVNLVGGQGFITAASRHGQEAFKTVMETDNSPTTAIGCRNVAFNHRIDTGAVAAGVENTDNHVLLCVI